MTCDSANLIYMVICSGCNGEYIGETEINKQKLRNRVIVYRHHIRQPEYQHLKVEGHSRNCSNGESTIFHFYRCDLGQGFENVKKTRNTAIEY